MAEPAPAPAPSYQSLYRRYRPQRFDEVLGQDHVTRALRNAVRDGRVGHAYLFSGPRGTGKTSTARILAKVLNCANPVDGEPDGTCDNCRAVERGQVVDWLLEQDAASKSKVDDMRDLLDRVPLGTSGNRKVIILDEVHMLSQGAENALLKTLEEPPSHVVFVLATTDPQKVRPTIRSRTQHFAFHLLPPDMMAEHMRHVIADAGLDLADVDDAVTHVVRSGGGSARDTLSALDQVAALGEVVADSQPVEAILDALAERDAGAALVAVADACATGRDPRALGEAVIVRLRDAFLALMGVPDAQDERARALGDRLGAAGLTRALDVLGEALTELSRKPDPRVVLEVALVRLVRPDADRDLAAVLDRLERLERTVASGAVPTGGGPVDPSPSSAPATTSPPPTDEDAAPSSGESSADAAPPPASPGGPSGPDPSPGAGAGRPADAARAALAAKRAKQERGGPAPRSAADTQPSADQPADAPPPSGPASATAPASGQAGNGPASPTAQASTTTSPASGQAGNGPASPTAQASTTTSPASGQAGKGPASPPAQASTTTSPASGQAGGASTSASGEASAPTSPAGGTSSAGGGASGPGTEQGRETSGAAVQAGEASAGGVATATDAPAAAASSQEAEAAVVASPEATAPSTQASVAAGGSKTTAGGVDSGSGGAGGGPDLGALTSGWSGQVLGELPLPVRSKWRGGSWVEVTDGRARFATPNEWHKKACDEGRLAVEQALAAHFGSRVAVEVVVAETGNGSSGPGGAGAGEPATAVGGAASTGAPNDEADEVLSPDEVRELKDAGNVATGGVDLLLREFGGELIEEDPT